MRLTYNQYFTFCNYTIFTCIWSVWWPFVSFLFNIVFSGKCHTSCSYIDREKPLLLPALPFSVPPRLAIFYIFFLQRAPWAPETELSPLPLRSWHSICIALICPAQKEGGRDVRNYLLQFKVSFLFMFCFSLLPPLPYFNSPFPLPQDK